jgi:hypothetical protein
VLTHAPWTAVPGLRHGFLDGRECTAAPDWASVLAAAGAPLPIRLPKQVHGAHVVAADAWSTAPHADGVVIDAPGQLTGIVTADCVPVLLVARDRRGAAAVHAGWRGAAAGVLEAAVEHMRSSFDVPAAAIEAAIGPAVGACCYEVGAEVRDAFRARTGETTAAAWEETSGRLRVDLRAAVRLLLAAAGVTQAAILGPCTMCGSGYASYRRDGPGAGRQLSFVGWAAP